MDVCWVPRVNFDLVNNWEYLGPWDVILTPLFIVLAYGFASRVRAKNELENPVYRYFTKGILAKIAGGIGLGIIYVFYYQGGDTLNYWQDAGTLRNLMFKDFFCYLDILFGDTSTSNFFCFDEDETGLPMSIFIRDPNSYAVTRLASIPYLLSIDSFFGCTVLMAVISFAGNWRLYLMFTHAYPKLTKELAIAVLFVPSVLFWGSGILKDTITFSAACWFTYSFYQVFIIKEKITMNVLTLLFMALIIVSIKPYIFVALIPGCAIWAVSSRVSILESAFLKVMIAPMIMMVTTAGLALLMSQASSRLGAYGSVDTILDKAVATQQDLKRDAYKGNAYDIGDFDPSVAGILSKAPAAIFAGLFRPTILDVRNVVMFISAVENAMLLLFFLFLFFRLGPLSFIGKVMGDPIALFCFTFAIFFAFSVGLTTSNFGSLVRYKIPAMPFFLSGLYIIRYHWMKQRGLIDTDEDDDQSEGTAQRVEIDNSAEARKLRREANIARIEKLSS